MRVLVTGGMGFIGSNFIRYLLRAHPEYSVINLDLLTYAGNKDNLRDVENDPHYQFVQGDICDRDLVDSIIKAGITTVINFAAESHVDRSILGADAFMRTNALGTFILLDVARKHHVQRFVQISTDEVYGSLEDNEAPWTEEAPLNPRNPYAVSKAVGDMMAKSFLITYGLPVLITRASNNIGPFQYPEKRLPLFITNAIDDLPLPVYGSGMAIRDHLHVLDHCEAIDLVLHRGIVGEVYNIGAGSEMNGLETVETVLELMEKPKTLIKLVTDRPGHDMRYTLDTAKIHALGWKPRHDFGHALRDTVTWYKENQSWWRKIKASYSYQEYYQQQYGERLQNSQSHISEPLVMNR